MSTVNPYPIRLGDAADFARDFARVRRFLAAAAFDEPRVCAALKLDHIGELIEPARDGIYLDELAAALRWCIQVFVQGVAVGEAESRAACGEDVFASLTALGLLRADRARDAITCPVWLYPVDGVLIVSDRHREPDGRRSAAPADAVFSACFEGTLHFLHLLPEAAGGDALDLCGGTGIGALHLSRTASSAVTADVTPRAACFAAFNAGLNDAPVESLCGDVYAAVGARQFDLIACHPPYLPAGGEASLSRDGGETGEDITRRTIEGLPEHLRIGGVGVIASLGCDRGDAPFERRAHDWLGAAAGEFGVAFGLLRTHSIEEIAGGIGRFGEDDAETAAWAARLRARGVERFVYGVLVFKRHGTPTGLAPMRVPFAPTGCAADLLALLEPGRPQAAR